MHAAPPPEQLEGEDDDRPPLPLLIRQLADDARTFAHAEVRYVKSRVGEGWGHAIPGLVAIGVSIALLFGAFIALPLGSMLILADYVGIALSVPIVMGVTALLGMVLLKFGTARLKASLKLPEDR